MIAEEMIATVQGALQRFTDVAAELDVELNRNGTLLAAAAEA